MTNIKFNYIAPPLFSSNDPARAKPKNNTVPAQFVAAAEQEITKALAGSGTFLDKLKHLKRFLTSEAGPGAIVKLDLDARKEEIWITYMNNN